MNGLAHISGQMLHNGGLDPRSFGYGAPPPVAALGGAGESSAAATGGVGGEAPKRKTRSVQSCTRCRARKTKCDRKFPCGPCSLRNEQDSCVEYIKEKSDKPTGYVHLADFQALTARVARMEGYITVLRRREGEMRAKLGLDGAVDPGQESDGEEDDGEEAEDALEDGQGRDAMGIERRPSARGHVAFSERTGPEVVQPKPRYGTNAASFGEGDGGGGHGTVKHLQDEALGKGFLSDPVSRAPSRAEHDAALTLEDLALARGANIQRGAPAKYPFSHIESAFDKAAPTMPPMAPRLPNYHLLPTVGQARPIIDFYLNRVDWTIRTIHRPTFKAQCLDLWSHDARSPMSPSQFSFLPLYCACLATSLHLMESSDVRSLGFGGDDDVKLPRMWWELGYAAMEKMDWMQVHSMGSLQAIVVIGTFFASINRGEYHWTLLGTANKIAQNMGLSRLGPEPTERNVSAETIIKRFGARWVSAVDREVGRRIWANLVELDITFSIEKNMTYSIHERQHKAVEPANIDDEDIPSGHGPIVARDRDYHTSMSFFLERLRLMYPIQKLVGQINEAGRVKYSFIMDAHQEYEHIIQSTPLPFREDDEDEVRRRISADEWLQIRNERVFLNNATCLRLLRVHRIYLSSSYQSARYQLSREVCLSCARSLVRSGLSPIAVFQKPHRYWQVNYGIFCACVVLFFELCRSSNEEASHAKAELQDAIRGLRENAGNPSFTASAEALEKLMEEESKQRATRGRAEPAANGSNKRKRTEESGGDTVLNRLVKRVILFNSPQATSSLASPSSSSVNLPSPNMQSLVANMPHSADPFAPGSLPAITPDLEGFPGASTQAGDWGMFASLNDDLFNYEDLLRYTLPQDPLDGAGATMMDGMGNWAGGSGAAVPALRDVDMLAKSWAHGAGSGTSPANW